MFMHFSRVTPLRCLLAALLSTGPAAAQFGPSGQAGPGGDQSRGLDPMESNYWRSKLQGGSDSTVPGSSTPAAPPFDTGGLTPWQQGVVDWYATLGELRRGMVARVGEELGPQFVGPLGEGTPHIDSYSDGQVSLTNADVCSVLMVLMWKTPPTRVVLKGSVEEWSNAEKELARLVENDPAAARKVEERFGRIRELVWSPTGSNPRYRTTQKVFDQIVAGVGRAPRINGLLLDFSGTEVDPIDGVPAPAVDLRGLAKVRLASLELTVDSLAELSFGFPGGLRALAVREYAPSADPLGHLRLPARLRAVSVISPNQATRDRFAALARDLQGAAVRTSEPPPEGGSAPRRKTPRVWAGLRQKDGPPGGPKATAVFDGDGIHAVSTVRRKRRLQADELPGARF